MPSQQTLNRFIECVVSGAHDRACEAFYAIDSTMQENGNPSRVGREAHVANERRGGPGRGRCTPSASAPC
jgi:hypothetical protein